MRRKTVLCILMLLISATGFAQKTVTVSGKVMEAETDLPAVGVSILVKGNSSKGTISNADGKYTLKDVPSNETLVFKFMGMKTIEVPVNGKQVINVTLEDDVQNLEDVVVIGYGSSKAKDLTSPIAVVKSEEISKHATTSPMGSLQGKVAGVNIINSGAPGAGPEVRVRGLGSFGNTNPLYVVDGMFYDNINFLNNNDIDNISILKDASAASIYGVRAANGVVIVTTKKGTKNSKASITYDGYVGVQRVANKLKMASSSQYAEMIKEAGTDAEKSILQNSINLFGGDYDKNIYGANTDWYGELLRNALIHNHSLDISGGTEKSTYSFGINYLKQEGVMKAKNEYERVNMRAKVDYDVFKWLKIGANLVMSNATQYSPDNSAWLSAYQMPSLIPVMDETRSSGEVFPKKYASPTQIGLSGKFTNPIAKADYHDDKSEIFQILPAFSADINFLPENKLTFRTVYSQDVSLNRNRLYKEQYYVGNNQQQNLSSLKKTNSFYSNYIWDNTLTYRDNFNGHGLTAMLGHSSRSEDYRQLWGQAFGVPGSYEEYLYLTQGNATGRETGDDGTTYRGLSYFGRVSYDYNGKYLLSATMRADGSSKYQDKWGYFPSVGAAWVISNENFMKGQNVIDYLKLRASWGKLGNDKVSASDGFASISSGLGNSGIFGDTSVPGYVNNVYFSWLGWEVVNETNIGLDFSLFRSRLGVEVDYFYRLTQNAVIDAPLPMGAGLLKSNSGEILNKGLELSINWNDKIGKNFSYSVGANITTLKNKVKSLNGAPYIYGGSAEFRNISRVGSELNSYYGYKVLGVYQNMAEINADPIAIANNLQPGDFRYQDVNGDKKIDDQDRQLLGSNIPDFSYGFNLGLNWKGLEFSMVFQGQGGNEIVNKKRGERIWNPNVNYDADQVENRWTGEGSTNKYPSAAGSIKSWNNGKMSSFYVEDASYFRIQNVQLAYTLDNLKIKSFKIPSVRFSLTADRPYTHFKSNGFTPEVTDSRGWDEQVYPTAATYTFGVRINY